MTVADDVRSLALVGGTLIDGNGGAALSDATLIVRGNRIVWVGPAREAQVPDDATTVDTRGKWILPGLIDSHVHIGTSGGGNANPAEFAQATLASNLKSYLVFGVTSIMDMGGQPHLDAIASKIAYQELLGPRLFGVRYGVTAPESHPIGLLREFGALEKMGSHFLQVDDAETARALVRRIATEHPAGLKIYHSRTEFPGTMCLDCNRDKLRPEVLAALVDEGHAQGLRVFAHIAYPSEAREVVLAGADVLAHPITHAESGVDEVTELMVERGVMMHSTLTRVEAYFGLMVNPFAREMLRGKVADTVLDGLALPRSVVLARHTRSGVTEDARRILETTMANVRRANEAGVTIVMGTDSGGAGGFHGACVPREMELLNECGLTPMAVIVAATRNAARSLGMSDELGTLEATKLADVAILDADPLQRTSHIRQVSAILKDGMLIDVAQISVNEGVSRVG